MNSGRLDDFESLHSQGMFCEGMQILRDLPWSEISPADLAETVWTSGIIIYGHPHENGDYNWDESGTFRIQRGIHRKSIDSFSISVGDPMPHAWLSEFAGEGTASISFQAFVLFDFYLYAKSRSRVCEGARENRNAGHLRTWEGPRRGLIEQSLR